MFVIDENISEIEVWRLREFGIRVRVIGEDLAFKSISDENILPLLHKLKEPSFFTRDRDFWKQSLCHPNYSLIYLDLPEQEGVIASYIRKFLKNPDFKTRKKRLGKVFLIHPDGIQFWQFGTRQLMRKNWNTQ